MHPLNLMHSSLPGSGYDVKFVRLALRNVPPPPVVVVEPPVVVPPPVVVDPTKFGLKSWAFELLHVQSSSFVPSAPEAPVTSTHLPELGLTMRTLPPPAFSTRNT